MKLSELSNIVLKFTRNGTVKVTNVELTQSTIQAYLVLAYGYVMASVIERKKRMGELDSSYLISGAILSSDLDIKFSGKKSLVSIAGLKIMKLDNAMQIVGFDLPSDDCGCQQGRKPNLETITYVQPNEAKFYQGVGYENLFFYTFSGSDIVIYNTPECLKKISLQYVSDASEIDIPEDVCLSICKVAFPDIFGVKKFGKDKIDDNSNDQIEQLKLQINAGA